jgi:hypothetical protein
MTIPKRLYAAAVIAGLFLISLWICPTIFLASAASDKPPNPRPIAPDAMDSALNLQVRHLSEHLPLYFIPNQGQKDRRVKFYSHRRDRSFGFTPQGIILSLHTEKTGVNQSSVVQLTPLGLQPQVQLTPLEPLEGKVNYFIGNDPKKWRTNIPTYRAVLYREAYPGIDLKFYGDGQKLEYDVIVKPGAEPRQVRFRYQGIRSLKLTPEGDLAITLPDGSELKHQKPLVYQEIAGHRLARPGTFQILDQATHTFGFRVAAYDKHNVLIIDPVLRFSTYLGGIGEEQGKGIAVDKDGNICVTGYTKSSETSFPLVNAYRGTKGDTYYADVFITKYNASCTAMVFSTYFGGDRDDYGNGIAVDDAGNIYVTGRTGSYSSFPLVNAFQDTFGGAAGTQDAFVAKFDKTGQTLLYSSYLGGDQVDTGNAIAVDRNSCAYVAGETDSADFPTTDGAYQETDPASLSTIPVDTFVTKVSADGTSKVYSTYFGGDNNDQCIALALDQSGDNALACIAGWTWSSAATFPLENALQPTRGISKQDAYVAKLNADGSGLIFSTFLGGDSYDEARGIAVDNSGYVCVTGWTGSSNFPNPNALYPTRNGSNYDAFVTKYLPDGSDYVFSTYLGCDAAEYQHNRIAVDPAGNIYVTGMTPDYTTVPFPLKNEIFTHLGSADIFLTKFKPDGSALVYSTYLGGSLGDFPEGIAVDRAGNVYLTGYTSSADFHTRNPFQSYQGGKYGDAFVIKVAELSFNPGSLWLLLKE